ncbi:MAG: DUF1836 domain-containing protein [Eubacteriaceae bacterium]|nr:DUF1836 domain-containing protein [Eubacteriaceae bacterium]
MYTRDEILNYRCPKWNDWPDIGLYMDQATRLLESHVAGFSTSEATKAVTPMMINNYVKRKIIKPSKNKAYNREHLAHLYILFMLKPVLSLSEICESLAYASENSSFEDVYNSFCANIESAIAIAFGSESENKAREEGILSAFCLAFAYYMLAKLCLSEACPGGES